MSLLNRFKVKKNTFIGLKILIFAPQIKDKKNK